MSATESDAELLRLFEKLHGIAQTGLTYAADVFDRERYHQLQDLTVELARRWDGPMSRPERAFYSESGYRTPKVDVRAVVLQQERVLLVRERSDGRWSLPGGWADIGESPARCVEKEVREETGYDAKATRLLALLDRDQHAHGAYPWHAYKVFFHCEISGRAEQSTLETEGSDFFSLDDLPELSVGRVTELQIRRLCAMVLSSSLEPWFD